MDQYSPIGVFDSGVGGFTVARQMRRLLPQENIVYYGDSAHMPYGSRPVDEILRMTRQMLAFLAGRGVKAAAVACNTISTLIDYYRSEYPFRIFSVIEAGAASVADLDVPCVGVIGTPVTVHSKAYDRLIHGERPDMKVYSQGVPNLARLIDAGDLRPEVIDSELRAAVDPILAQGPTIRWSPSICTASIPALSSSIPAWSRRASSRRIWKTPACCAARARAASS